MALEHQTSVTSEASSSNVITMMEEAEPMVTILPQHVIDALAELDLELSEGKPMIFLKV